MTRNRYSRIGSPLGLHVNLLGPGGGGLGGEARVVARAGGRVVGELGAGQRGGPVILDDDGVVLGHVHGGRQLVVT